MDHSSWLKPRKPGASRRDFFKRSGNAAVAAASLAALPLAAEAHRRPVLFQHGVASGDPLADRVILWTRVTPPVRGWERDDDENERADDDGDERDERRGAHPRHRRGPVVRWEVARDPKMRHVVRRGRVRTDESRDHTVKIDVTGLRPGTTYYYRFECRGEASPVGRTRTLPRGAPTRMRLAVVSCSNHAAGFFNAYARIAERADLDAVLHLGDYLYEYGPDEYGSARAPEPPREMVTLADYRQRHAQYKRDADSQAAHRQHPFICIWDDHEITNDAWRDGAQNHTEGAEGRWPERVAVGLQAYYEWMPVRQPDPRDPRRNQRGFRLGDLADLFMLEERLSARSQQLPATVPTPFGNGFVQAGPFLDPARTLLGEEQEAWLAAGLRGSKARWKLLGQGVMFAHLKLVGAPLAAGGGVFVNADQWDGYQPARDRLYAVLKGDAVQPPVNDVVVLTGDIHSSWASDLTQDPNNPAPAAGGYDAATGTGSRAVEFVTTSVSSPGLNDPTGSTAAFLRGVNPHIKYIDFNQRGYMLLDITRERIVSEWWYVDTVASRTNIQSFGAAFEVRHGSNRLQPSAATTPRSDAPPLAP
jgi:alkaline phosphatase D